MSEPTAMANSATVKAMRERRIRRMIDAGPEEEVGEVVHGQGNPPHGCRKAAARLPQVGCHEIAPHL
jgi:hypothetical protein